MTRLLFIWGCVYVILRTAKDQNIFIMNQYIKGCTFSFTMTLKYSFIANIRSRFPENY